VRISIFLTVDHLIYLNSLGIREALVRHYTPPYTQIEHHKVKSWICHNCIQSFNLINVKFLLLSFRPHSLVLRRGMYTSVTFSLSTLRLQYNFVNALTNCVDFLSPFSNFSWSKGGSNSQSLGRQSSVYH